VNVIGHDNESVAISPMTFQACLQNFKNNGSCSFRRQKLAALVSRERNEMGLPGEINDSTFGHRYA
jgi:hypothetical protein